jgi:hypothetical protein
MREACGYLYMERGTSPGAFCLLRHFPAPYSTWYPFPLCLFVYDSPRGHRARGCVRRGGWRPDGTGREGRDDKDTSHPHKQQSYHPSGLAPSIPSIPSIPPSVRPKTISSIPKHPIYRGPRFPQTTQFPLSLISYPQSPDSPRSHPQVPSQISSGIPSLPRHLATLQSHKRTDPGIKPNQTKPIETA